MTIKLTPALKGLITAVLMIVVILIIDARRDSINPNVQYLRFVVYGLGIIWTLIAYSNSSSFQGSFSSLFGQGFRCFMVVTLIMVIFSIVFIKMHPEFAIAEAKYQRELLEKEKNRMPSDIDELEARAKKQYPMRYISASIFGYLILGAAVTAIGSALLTRRN